MEAQAGGTGSVSGGGSGGGARGAGGAATRASLSFTPRGTAASEAQSLRVAERWAPETIEQRRSPSLRALSFVDRLLAPQRTFFESPVPPAYSMPASASRFLASSG